MDKQWMWLLILVGVCTLGCTVIFILTLSTLSGFDLCLIERYRVNAPGKSIKWLSQLSLLSFAICCGSGLFVILQLDKDGQVIGSTFQQIIQLIGLFSWTLAQLFIYLLFIANLHYSFKHTMLRLSNRNLICLTITIILFC